MFNIPAFILIIIAVIIAVIYTFIKQKLRSQREDQSNASKFAEIERLKRLGEKIKMTLDNCEIKNKSYQVEEKEYFSKYKGMDSLLGDDAHYKSTEIQQTYIVFYKKYGERSFKFISQAVNHDPDAFKFYLDSSDIFLYIDRQNPNNYHFEIPIA